MSVKRIATRYAKALIDYANETNQLEEVLADVQSFRKAAENRDLYLLLKSPIVNNLKKLQIFKSLFKSTEKGATYNFFTIILRKGREKYLPEISDEFVALYKKKKQISMVKLTTASALSDEHIQKIKKILLESKATDQSVELEQKIDPTLMGGFVIEIEDKLFDASIKHKLELLRKNFSMDSYA